MFPGMDGAAGGEAGDPFRDIRGSSSEGSLLGGFTWAICAAVCFACCLVSLLLAYVIWALITIFTSGDAVSTACGEKFNIWLFCLVTVIIMPLVGCVTSLVANLGGIPMLMMIPPVVNLFFFFWGFLMWVAIDTECMIFFEQSYWDLTLLFKINVVLLSITFFLLCCFLCLGVAVLGAGGMGAQYPQFAGGDDEDEKDAGLRNAAAKGDADEVERLLNDGASHAAREKSSGNQALHCAAQAGRTEICRKLVEAGASIDDANLTGETPLALARGHADTEEYLKGLGARANTAEAAASTQDYV